MPPVLRTKKDAPAITLAGVGLIPANGVGGVLVERAAQSLPELQDGDGNPLEGAALKKAAQEFADERGLDVGDVSDAKVAKLPELAGGFADRPPAVEVAEAEAAGQNLNPAGEIPAEESATPDPTQAQS